METNERLKELLTRVPDTYWDFEFSMLHFPEKYGYTDQLIEYMEQHPDARTDDIIEFAEDIEDALGIPADDCDGISPFPDDE